MRFLLLILLTGCTSAKLLRLENQALDSRNTELTAKLNQCSEGSLPEDYTLKVSQKTVLAYLDKAGFEGQKVMNERVVGVPITGKNTTFQVNIQHFKREKVLYMAATGYLRLEQATTSKSMVLLLTQLASMNYDLLIGKFQLNPGSGEITLSAEINLDDGMGFQTFQSVLRHLIQTADTKHPDLVRAAKGQGI